MPDQVTSQDDDRFFLDRVSFAICSCLQIDDDKSALPFSRQ